MATPEQQLEQELVLRPYRVMLIAGIGVSVATCGNHTCASWKGLLHHGLQRCEETCGTTPTVLGAYRGILNDPAAPTHALITVGQFITDELSRNRPGLYASWLLDAIGGITATDTSLVSVLATLGVKLATTNYDNMIEDGTRYTPITWRDRGLASVFLRDATRDVLHLHGHFRQPESVVLGARSYGDICRDEFFQAALRGHMVSGTLLFVGCGAGLEDPNFGTLLEWGRTTLAQCPHSHFILVRSTELEDWREKLRGIPIVPIGYGPDHRDLTPFLHSLAERVQQQRVREPLTLLSARQTDFDSRWAELERSAGELALPEYFRRSQALAAELWQAGGRRRAAMEFSGRVQSQGQGLLAADYVDFSLTAADWLLDDELPLLAGEHLQTIERRLAGAEVPAPLVARFRQLRVRCMDALCAYVDSLRAIQDALAHADEAERARLQAERSEIYFLQGDLGNAIADAEGG